MSGAQSDGAGRGARVLAVALNTYREAVRNRVMYVLVVFCALLLAGSLVIAELSLNEDVRVITDLGLAGVSVFGVVIALFLGVNLLAKELERKTIYFMIAKPLQRWEFVLGKYLGLAATMWVICGVMTGMLLLLLVAKGAPISSMLLMALVLVALELTLLVAVAVMFGAFSSPYLSAMFTAGLWIIGRNGAQMRMFASSKRYAGTAAGEVLSAVSRIVPDFSMFYVSGATVAERTVSLHGTFVSAAYVANAALYAAAYTAVALALAMLAFRRRDFV